IRRCGAAEFSRWFAHAGLRVECAVVSFAHDGVHLPPSGTSECYATFRLYLGRSGAYGAMRILYHHRIRSKDGQFVHMEGLITALKERGHEVIIVGPAAVEREEFGAEAGLVDVLKRWLPRFAYELMEFAYAFFAYVRLWRAV